MKEKRTFPAHLDHLHPFLKWLEQGMLRIGFSKKDAHKIEISCEEAFVNIVQHANPQGDIDILLELKKGGIEIIFRDEGMAFNPLEKDVTIDKEQELDERKIGGLGIFMMKEFMDEISYERDEFYNVLTLYKKKDH